MDAYGQRLQRPSPLKSIVIGTIVLFALFATFRLFQVNGIKSNFSPVPTKVGLLFAQSTLRRLNISRRFLQALVVLSGDSSVSGSVVFEQQAPGQHVQITLKIKGLTPNAQRGFHIQ